MWVSSIVYDAIQYSLMKQSIDLKVMVLNVLLAANEVISEEVFRFAIVKTVGPITRALAIDLDISRVR